MIEWFKSLRNKNKLHFIQYDISEYYPSITEKLLMEAVTWAENYTYISEEDKAVILVASNSLLYSNGQPWKKKNCQNFFDLTMGSFHACEACELVGLYLLSQLVEVNLNGGLYRDDGLGVMDGTRRQNENTKKKICEIFRRNNLKITVEVNMKTVDFLDVTLDLSTDTFKPFLKPNNTLLYVNTSSNHPPNIVKNIPESINKRLNSLSKNEDIFNQAIPPYQEALHKSGYKYQLNYKPPQENLQRRRRNRNIIWYNPPFCKSVKTNIGKQFFRILAQCFPAENPLSKLFNKNTVKLSYSCMPNVASIISGHNKKVINTEEGNGPPPCTCTLYDCEVEGKCEQTGVIYQCKVTETTRGTSETYIGLTANSFKDRLTKHRRSFRVEGYHRNSLSTHIWDLKRRQINFEISWRIVAKARPYSPSAKYCKLCIKEIYYILFERENSSLNKRQEFFGYCLHKSKFLLENQ